MRAIQSDRITSVIKENIQLKIYSYLMRLILYKLSISFYTEKKFLEEVNVERLTSKLAAYY
jgi:ABC-type xylose transport system permease subunit